MLFYWKKCFGKVLGNSALRLHVFGLFGKRTSIIHKNELQAESSTHTSKCLPKTRIDATESF